MIPLTFGEQADWFRNVQAAGGCTIRWNGVNYPVIEPVVVDWATARSAFYPVERVVVPLIGIEHFVWLRSELFKSAVRSHDYLADLEQRLSAIKEMPALLIFGETDGLVKLGWLARLERIFPRHRSIVMLGCHHFPQVYDAPGVATAIGR